MNKYVKTEKESNMNTKSIVLNRNSKNEEIKTLVYDIRLNESFDNAANVLLRKGYNIKDIKRSYGNGRIFFHVVLSDDITEQHVVELFRNVIYKHIKNRKQGIILIIKTEKGESQNCYQLNW